MKRLDKYLGALGIFCIAAITVTALMFPGARLSFLLPAAGVCGAFALWIYSRCPFRTTAGMAILMIGYTLVVCGIIWNINYFTISSGGTYDYPVLENNDSRTDWCRAVNGLYGDPVPQFVGLMNVRYYIYIMEALMWVLGRDIGVTLIFNALCYSLAIILIGAIAWQLTSDRITATVTMGVATLMCYLMVQATVLIKDVPLTMCVAAVTLVLIRWRTRFKVGDLWLLVPSIVGIAFLRANFLLMLMVGIVILGINVKRQRIYFLALFAIVALLFGAMQTFFIFPDVAGNVNGDKNSMVFVHNQNVRAWDMMLAEDYVDMPIWKRVVWLPASILVQFLIPFPWNYARDMVFGPTECVAHFGYFWYYAGALLLYWIFTLQRQSPLSMRLIVLWGVLLTIATAYMTSGRVSRYCLIYLPMLLPAVGYTLTTAIQRRSLWIWIGVFTLLLIPALIICHHLQMSA